MALVLDCQRLRELKEYAENHRIDLQEMIAIRDKQHPPVGDRDSYRLYAPVGYKIVFSIDETLDHNWIRHMSMSVNTPDRYPNEYALREVCRHLGYKNLDECIIQQESFNTKAIEVIEFIE